MQPQRQQYPANGFKTFGEFWPYYLGEHTNLWNRRLHAVGTTLALFIIVAAIATEQPWFLVGALVSGYFFAWIGHFIVERNRPATFKHPFWSLMGDFKMYWLFITGQLKAPAETSSSLKT